MKIAIILVCLLPGQAFAHVGPFDGSPFLTGLIHPFTGMDHVAAMIAVGIWSTLVLRNAWSVPLVFASLLLIGGLIGFSGITLPAVEHMIALSVLVTGMLLAQKIPLAPAVGLPLIGLFGIFHGVAHGSEMSSSQMIPALAGMTIGTWILHFTGMGLGLVLHQRPMWLGRALGGGISLLGAAFLFSAF
ncbi:HupE/UreJ family protein [Ectothiorhodospira lacustris]|uniref:HupE/UreJ family protein n=1 Tax=Ectothiorhodospira lacustris TaxID=2899127 RepID=UPI001EE79ADD|nr:HupE/UreJ family protein [Ectothiorhodospira lacustris]MCG5501617.1 HupE/UreJ family protein [Ectothiorhodospira lacustris]